MPDRFDPYHQWLGIPPEDQPPNHYRLLAIPLFEPDPNVIENAADRQMAHLRVFQAGKHGKLSQQLLNEVAAARVALLNAEKKAAYDARLRAEMDGPPTADHQGVPAGQEKVAAGAAPAGARRPPVKTPVPAPAKELELPIRDLGEYHLIEKLGEGGMGTVYKAMHTKLAREVAVKVLTTARLGSESAIARFEREMRAVGRLDHPNIIRAHDAREIDGARFLVMELVDGLDLTDVLQRAGPLPVADACEIVRQAALGLQAAHEGQLIHRDIKPGNLMLTAAGQVKILDLGLARFEVERAGEEVTDTGTALGTLDYMAPEQTSGGGHRIDIRADIYSLGCTLYKLLAGRAPFDEPRYAAVMDKIVAHAKKPPVPIVRLRRDVPKELVSVLNRMMAKDPARRFQTPAEVADAVGPLCVGADLAALLATARHAPSTRAPARALQETHGSLSNSLTNFFRAIAPGQRAAGSTAARPANNKRLVLGIGAALSVVLVAGALVWALLGARPTEEHAATSSEPARPTESTRGALVLRLSDEEREATDLRVNNVRVRLPDSEPWEIPSRPGTYQVRLVRKGFEPYEETVRIEPGRKVTLTPKWVPGAKLVLIWPASQRQGARLQVDGRPVPLPSGPDEPDEFLLPAEPGTRLVWAERRGYLPFSRTIELGHGEQHRLAVEWEATAPPEQMAVVPPPEPDQPKPPEEPKPAPEPEPESQPEVASQPAPAGPSPEDVAAMKALEALEAAEAKWKAATKGSEDKVAAWDFAGALAALEGVRFDDAELTARLARRKDELKRMAALKDRMIAHINAANPPLKKSDLMLRGFAGELTGADQQAITATQATGRTESLPWSDLGSHAPGKLLQLVVDKASGDDWLSCGVFALGIGDVELAERLLAKAGSMGIDIGPYRAVLAARAFEEAKKLLDAGQFQQAEAAFEAIEKRYGAAPSFDPYRAAVAAGRTTAAAGTLDQAAEKLYTEAAKLYTNGEYFDLKPLVERLKSDFGQSRFLNAPERKPSLAEMETATAKLGKFITVRQDGKGDYRSIQAAIDKAPPNSTIEIQDNGPYHEAIRVGKDTPGITLRGRRGCWPLIPIGGRNGTGEHRAVRVTSPRTTLERLLIVRDKWDSKDIRLVECADQTTLRCILLAASPGSGVNLGQFGRECVFEACFILPSFGFMVATPGVIRNTIWLADFEDGTSGFRGEGTALVENVYANVFRSSTPCTLRSSTVRGILTFDTTDSSVKDSIVGSIVSRKPDNVIEFCDVVTGKYVDQAKPGQNCFSADPLFLDPQNLDYRLSPKSPCLGKASDGGDLGVHYTPEMMEIIKVALELRARGIIKF
ncbi:MAG: protein kinase [Thermoguttaceae bacterium]|jgi:serine/threonine protein kinase|nr:protein kinase [Thermoguttaceae bacterium]